MLLTIFGSILLVSVYSTLLYRWLQNLKKRVEGFYIGLYNGLDIPEDERHEYEISQPFLIFFWLTGLPSASVTKPPASRTSTMPAAMSQGCRMRSQ